MEDYTETTTPFPARTKLAAGEVAGIKTDVALVSFADKMMITITQGGRLAQWVGGSRRYLMLVVLKCDPGNGSTAQRQSDSI